MKSKLFKLAALALAIAMLAGTAACQLREEAKPNATSASDAGSDASRDEIAATVGGKFNITKGEVMDAYNNMISQYQYYGMTAPTEAADIESMQNAVVDMLVSEQVKLYQAEQMGITVDDAMRDQIDADTEDELEELKKMFRSQAESEGAADVDARTEEIFNEQLVAAGMDMDIEGYRAYVREQIEIEAIVNALTEKIKADVTVTDEDVRAYYDNLLATQKETYSTTPADYLDDAEGYEKFGGDPVLTTPEGFVRVKTITVVPQEELGADYESLTTAMTQLEAEFGKLSLQNASANAKRIAEIRTEYTAKKTDADALYDTYISAAREKANQAYADLKAGKTFDETLAKYGEDDVYTTYPVFATEGLLMQKGEAGSTWPAALVEAVGKLEAGAYTPVVQVDDMFYIAQLVGDEQPGDTAFEDVQEEMQRLATTSNAEEYWNAQVEAWVDDATLVTRNESVYRDIGK